MKQVAALISKLTPEEMNQCIADQLEIDVDGEKHAIFGDHIEVVRTPKEGMAVSENAGVVVAINTQLNEDLLCEGLAREFVSKIQNMRKEMNLEVTQRIHIYFNGDESIGMAVAKYLGYIQSETLALSCVAQAAEEISGVEWDLNGHPCVLSISTTGDREINHDSQEDR